MIRSMSLNSDFSTSPLNAMPALLYTWLPDRSVRQRRPRRPTPPPFGLANRIGQTFSVDVGHCQLCERGQIPRQRHARPGTGDDGDLLIE
jgi:hypothetical protein